MPRRDSRKKFPSVGQDGAAHCYACGSNLNLTGADVRPTLRLPHGGLRCRCGVLRENAPTLSTPRTAEEIHLGRDPYYVIGGAPRCAHPATCKIHGPA